MTNRNKKTKNYIFYFVLPFCYTIFALMKIFTGNQIRELDRLTIENEPIESINLMERAAKAITRAIAERWTAESPVVVFAGPGNNGGDALAVARMLTEKGYSVDAYLFNISGRLSVECATNRDRLSVQKDIKSFTEITQEFNPPQLEEGMIVIDGLFGSGLNKPLAGGFASLVKYINASPATIVSIDVPSGLMTEDNSFNVSSNIIRANHTLTLQMPKLAFLFPENQIFIGKLHTLDIGLSQDAINNMDAQYCMAEKEQISRLMMRRDDFSHKGNMGSTLLIAGSHGMAGAAVLASKASIRSGAGKVTVHTPRRNNTIMQISVPEVIVHTDSNDTVFSEPVDTEDFDAIGIGPGLGLAENTAIAMIAQIRRTQCPIVADADALNILANKRAWLQQLPKGIIMTPHPKEFDRLDGHSTNSFERLTKACAMAARQQAYIILKGRYSALCMPNGKVVFNTTGNAGMATAGSGDVLTGIITSLLARGYKREDACLIGMYIHGLAGDIAAERKGMESLIASDIIDCLPDAFKQLYE